MEVRSSMSMSLVLHSWFLNRAMGSFGYDLCRFPFGVYGWLLVSAIRLGRRPDRTPMFASARTSVDGVMFKECTFVPCF